MDVAKLRPPAPPPPGKRLGKYELISLIGAGGMAEVYLARQRGPANFEKLVVVKTINKELAQQPSFIQMLLDEARVSALIRHPRVVDIYDLGKAGDTYFIAMEYLLGQSLAEVITTGVAQRKPLDVFCAARIIADAADGLDAAHNLESNSGRPLGLVHRDVSPGNIIVLYDGGVKLVDFGIAKARGNLQSTGRRQLKGKIGYVSPEQIEGKPVDRRADVFALGVVLWEALTLRRLYRAATIPATLEMIQKGDPKPPSHLRREVPVELDEICLKALSTAPGDRYQSAAAMREALEAFLRAANFHERSSALGQYMQDVFAQQRQRQRALMRRATSSDVPEEASSDAAPKADAAPHESLDEESIEIELDDAEEVTGVSSPKIAAPVVEHRTSPAVEQKSGAAVEQKGGAAVEQKGGAAGKQKGGAAGKRKGGAAKIKVSAPLDEEWESTPAPAPDGGRRLPLPAPPAYQTGERPVPAPPGPVVSAQRAGLDDEIAGVEDDEITGVKDDAAVEIAIQGGGELSTALPSDHAAARPRAAETGPEGYAAELTADAVMARPRGSLRWTLTAVSAAVALALIVLVVRGATRDQVAVSGASDAPGERAEVVARAGAERAAEPVAEPVAEPAVDPTPDLATADEPDLEIDLDGDVSSEPAETPTPRDVAPVRPPRDRPATEPGPGPDRSERASARDRARDLYNRGARQYVEGNLSAAQTHFRNATRADPSYAPAYRGLGLVYERTGDTRRAIRALKQYLQLAPGASDATSIQQRIGRLGG